MNNHLAIKVDGKFLEISPDTSIDIEDSNPYFNDVQETYSYAFEVPLNGNRELLGNVDEVQSDLRLVAHENKPMSVIIDGIPMRNGKVATTEDQDIFDKISLSMTSNVRSLSDYFANLECQDIPVKDKIQIGEMIGNIWATFSATCTLKTKNSGKTGFLSWSWTRVKKTLADKESGDVEMELPALGYSVPGICKEDSNHYADGDTGKDPTILTKFTNVTDEYPAKEYCNARVCYLHYKKKEDGTSSDVIDLSSNGSESRFNPYLVLEADRQQSGVCFYVLYFLDCLFAYLKDYGISYDNSELMKVQDMRRLAFFTTHCKYDLERKYPNDYWEVNPETGENELHRVFDYNSKDEINRWLSSHNCGGELDIKAEKSKDIGGMKYNGTYYKVGDELPDGTTLRYANIELSNVETTLRANIMNMYANSMNFPKESVQTIIDSLWASFGIRFYLDQETRVVKPMFIRDIFRNSSEPIVMHCTVISAKKVNEKITGFRMRYSAESDQKEQNANIYNGVRDYNTDYDYKDYRRIKTDETYQQIIKHCGLSDMTLYVDKTTGNKYRVKVDGEAETAAEYHPVIFEVGQFKGVEIGDCSEESQDFVEEVTSSFQPVSFNDVNGRTEKAIGTEKEISVVNQQTGATDKLSSVNASDKEQVLAAFIDEDMWHEYCERKVQTAFGDDYADLYLVETISTKEAFDPSSTDEGTSPLQEYDWGTSIALMRGGGTDARIEYYDYDYDGFGNSKWRMVPGLYGMSADSIDCWGAVYDYNGTASGVGDEDGRFSLKIRAYINDPDTGEALCDSNVARRGLYDNFMSDYAHFVLNRKPVKLEVQCEVSELLNIQWDRKYDIGGYVGWINKISSHITAANGLETVTIEMFVL